MTQPWDPGFDQVLSTWWIEINHYHVMPMDLEPGHANPLRDWARQREPDVLWYYALDDRDEPDWLSLFDVAQHLSSIEYCHVTTALYITSQIAPDLLHEIEIPGIWLVRVQKTLILPEKLNTIRLL